MHFVGTRLNYFHALYFKKPRVQLIAVECTLRVSHPWASGVNYNAARQGGEELFWLTPKPSESTCQLVHSAKKWNDFHIMSALMGISARAMSFRASELWKYAIVSPIRAKIDARAWVNRRKTRRLASTLGAWITTFSSATVPERLFLSRQAIN